MSASSSRPVLLLMDSPRKEEKAGELGQLLVDMTAQVQDERARRSEVEKRNHSLMLEIEQLQRDMLDLKTSCVSERRRHGSGADEESSQAPSEVRDESADFWWKELQEVKRVKEKAVVEAHQRAMQVMELNACISMQHDELTALRATENEAREVAVHAEEQSKELLQQATILQQENRILKDDVQHLNAEIGKRGVHFKALMDKWTEAQAQSEHLERENHAMLERMKELRQRGEQLALELEKARDERDCLQHQVNHLKGAVAAKAAESKAFQAYGSNARDQLQTHTAAIQRQQVLRRRIHKVARESVVTLKTLRSSLAAVRAPIVAIQGDFRAFLRNLQAPVVSLVNRSRRFAEVAHAEHQPLRHALLNAELTRRHLHEQLWRSRRNALLVCQVRNAGAAQDAPEPGEEHRSLRANYATGELFLRESERETLAVKLDSVYSDRAREWSSFECVTPLVQSVLDGCNACVATFETQLPLQTTSREPVRLETVSALVLRELFDAARMHGARFHRIKVTVSYLGVYNECVYDLLGLDALLAGARDEQPLPQLATNQIVILEVQNLEEAMLVLRGGAENLESAGERGVMNPALTHKVVTVCLSYDNLLSGVATTKSKLQVVELAVGSQYTAVQAHDWDDRSKLKALVTMENGVNALTTALAEVRMKDPAFVRYHSSKLTVLLQDTIKSSAKFLAITTLPALIPPGDESKVSTVIRSIQQFRSAVSATSTSPWGKTTVAHRDRSLEGFMSRFAQQQQTQAQGGDAQPSALSLLFSSSDLQERSRQALDTDGGLECVRWEKELDNMNKRYGADVDAFATSFFQTNVAFSAADDRPGAFSSINARDSFEARGATNFPASPAFVGLAEGVDIDSDGGSSPRNLNQNTAALVHPHEHTTHPPPAPSSSSGSISHKTKSASGRSASSNSKGSRASSTRATAASSAHSRTLSDKKTKGKHNTHSQHSTTSISRTVGATSMSMSTYSARVAAKPSVRASSGISSSSEGAKTLAPDTSSSFASGASGALLLKIRRETASSVLKKSRLAALVASPSFKHKKRTPFK